MLTAQHRHKRRTVESSVGSVVRAQQQAEGLGAADITPCFASLAIAACSLMLFRSFALMLVFHYRSVHLVSNTHT